MRRQMAVVVTKQLRCDEVPLRRSASQGFTLPMYLQPRNFHIYGVDAQWN